MLDLKTIIRNICLIGFVLLVRIANGQNLPDIPIPTHEYDTNYIDKFDNLLAVRLVSPTRLYDFSIKNTMNGSKYVYSPNLQSAFGIGFTYKWLAFDITFNPKWNKKKTEKFGETKEFNVKASLYLKRHMLNVLFRTYGGLYIKNPEDYLDPWDGNYPYRPDIRNTSFNISYIIPFNYKKYSPKTTFLLDGRMKKSAGSVLYMSAFYISSLQADSTILPVEYEDSFPIEASIDRLNLALLQQSLGYAYTFIHNRYYLTLSAMPGLSYAFGNVYANNQRYSPSTFNFMLESTAGLGYNSRRWYAGLYFIFKYQPISLTDQINYNINLGELRFFIGYRIHAPYFVDKIIR